MTRKLLITGGQGQLGRDLTVALAKDFEITSPGRPELDITQAAEVAVNMESVHERKLTLSFSEK